MSSGPRRRASGLSTGGEPESMTDTVVAIAPLAAIETRMPTFRLRLRRAGQPAGNRDATKTNQTRGSQ